MMRSLRKPWAHQKEALEASANMEAYAFLMAMRTGKTKVTCDDYVRLYRRGNVRDLAVVAPGGVYETWVEAIAAEIGDPPEVYVWRSGKARGSGETRRRKEFMRSDGPRALLMNIEALSSVKEARETMLEYLRQSDVYLVVDESTAIKNPRAKRTKFVVRELGGVATVRRILSGLPTPKSPLDLFSQFDFLDWHIIGHRSWFTFRARYAILRKRFLAGRSFQEVVGYQNVEELQERIAPYSFRRTLEDCYDLPPVSYAFRHVEMTDEQKRVYSELRDFATSALDETDHVTATLVITQMLRLHQVLCGHVSDEMGQVHEIPERRTAELISLLEEYDGKAIIWASYDWDIQKIAAALAHEYGPGSVARFWGGNRGTREEEERRFKTDPACRFIVATPAAGGRGRTWDAADLVVYYSSTNDLEHRSQSEERPKAVGKKRPIAYVDLVVKGTVEEKIITALRAKINLAAAVTGDDYREWLV